MRQSVVRYLFCNNCRCSRSGRCSGGGAIGARYIIFDQCLEFLGNPLAAQRERLFPVDVDGGGGRLARAGKADADVGMLALAGARSEEHTSELQSQSNLVCRLLLEKKKNIHNTRSVCPYT